jgi:hypothetical protein
MAFGLGGNADYLSPSSEAGRKAVANEMLSNGGSNVGGL